MLIFLIDSNLLIINYYVFIYFDISKLFQIYLNMCKISFLFALFSLIILLRKQKLMICEPFSLRK